MEKSGHLAHYRSWLGSLESDPNYTRPTTDPIAKWDQALRPAGSHGMSFATFQRGLELGLPRDRILRPDWSRSHSIAFQVDHVLELQVAPVSQRTFFDSIDNFELLDSVANGAAGPRMAAGIARERAIQAQFDPTTVNRVLKFDAVELAGGNIGEHWTVDEIQNGEHLDALSKPR
jgi:hypothetical protein